MGSRIYILQTMLMNFDTIRILTRMCFFLKFKDERERSMIYHVAGVWIFSVLLVLLFITFTPIHFSWKNLWNAHVYLELPSMYLMISLMQKKSYTASTCCADCYAKTRSKCDKSKNIIGMLSARHNSIKFQLPWILCATDIIVIPTVLIIHNALGTN